MKNNIIKIGGKKYNFILPVDLSQCKPGDKLLSKHGIILELCDANEKIGFVSKSYPFLVKYPNGSFGTREKYGKTYIYAPMQEDNDIIMVLKEKQNNNGL